MRVRISLVSLALVLSCVLLAACKNDSSSPTEPSISNYTLTVGWKDRSCEGKFAYADISLVCTSGCQLQGEIFGPARLSNSVGATAAIRVPSATYRWTAVRPDNGFMSQGDVNMNSDRNLNLYCP